MSEKLSNYVKRIYPNNKSDLFAVMMSRCFNLLSENGYESMITMESWMFLSSFEKMRTSICSGKTITSLIHMPYLGKGGTSLGINFGTEMAVIRNSKTNKYIGLYDRIAYYETDEEGIPFAFPTINKYYKTTTQDNFSKIPGAPLAYWLSSGFFKAYEMKTLGSYSRARSGLQTSDNNRFLRLWFEVNYKSICFNRTSRNDS